MLFHLRRTSLVAKPTRGCGCVRAGATGRTRGRPAWRTGTRKRWRRPSQRNTPRITRTVPPTSFAASSWTRWRRSSTAGSGPAQTVRAVVGGVTRSACRTSCHPCCPAATIAARLSISSSGACLGAGKDCKYRHALPPGYVLKSQMKLLLEEEAANVSGGRPHVHMRQRAELAHGIRVLGCLGACFHRRLPLLTPGGVLRMHCSPSLWRR